MNHFETAARRGLNELNFGIEIFGDGGTVFGDRNSNPGGAFGV